MKDEKQDKENSVLLLQSQKIAEKLLARVEAKFGQLKLAGICRDMLLGV